MKPLTVLCIIRWALALGAYLGKIKGHQEANFDRELANLKLQQCNKIIYK
jgi:hypothetical protein